MKLKNYLSENKINYLNGLLKRTLLVAIIVLTILIICKTNNKFKEKINDLVYKENINFSKINKLYNQYVLKIKDIKEDAIEKVGKEKPLIYEEEKVFKDGVLLKTNKEYPVKALNSGLVSFIGEKDGLLSVVVEQSNGINVIYSNVDDSDLKPYDYIEKGTIIGKTNSDYLYLSFYRENEVLDYRPYIED